MLQAIIMSSGAYRLVSYGNGLSYSLELRIEGEPLRTVFVQGDDATQFRAELDALEAAYPETSTAKLLRMMWADYGDASTVEGE